MDANVIPTDAELHRLAIAVGEQLKANRLMLVTAESCTGGWIAKMITDIPGCSEWFDCGVAAYSYEAKQALLGCGRKPWSNTVRSAKKPAWKWCPGC